MASRLTFLRVAVLLASFSGALSVGCGGEDVNSAAVDSSLRTLSGVCVDGVSEGETNDAADTLLGEAEKGLDKMWMTAGDTERDMRSALEGAAATTSCQPDLSARFADAAR